MPEKLKSAAPSLSKSEKVGKRIAPKNTTIITKCDCIHPYQDKMYGNGMRVKNSTGSGYRCTVCRR